MRAQWEWASATVSAPLAPTPAAIRGRARGRQEVDFGRYAQAIAARWWLLVVGVVIGALIGFLVSLSTGRSTRRPRRSTLWKPPALELRRRRHDLTDDARPSPGLRRERGGDPEGRLGCRPQALEAPRRVTARRYPRHVDHAAGLSSAAAPRSRSRFLDREDGRRGKPPRAAGRGRGPAYTDTKIDTLDQQLAYIDTQIGLVKARLAARALVAEADLVGDGQPQPRGEARRRHEPQLRDHARGAATGHVGDQSLQHDTVVAGQDIEASRVTAAAVAVRTQSLTSRRTSVLVGAFIGFLLGDRGGAPAPGSGVGPARRAHGLGNARRQDRSRRRPRVRRGEVASGDAVPHL